MLSEDQKSEIREFVQEVLASPYMESSAATAPLQDIVAITARAIEVLGTREKVLRWLNAPVRSLGNQTPLSLLNTRQGITRVEDALGRMEHGVW
jgi:RES domain-containing protein